MKLNIRNVLRHTMVPNLAVWMTRFGARTPAAHLRISSVKVRRAWTFVFAFAWMFGCSVSHARVRYVYVYAEIPPDRMFSAAPGEKPIKPEDVVLRPRGEHLSLINHVMTPSQPGAFITVSSSEQTVRRQAAVALRNRPGVTGYIYELRADQSFYDVRLSLQRFVEQQRSMDLDYRYPGLEMALGVLIRMIENDGLFVTNQAILSGMVLSSTGYRGIYRPDGSLESTQVVSSQNNWSAFRYGANSGPSANTVPYDISWPQDTSLLGHLWVTEGEPGGWVQAALASQCLTGQGPSSHRHKRDAGEAGCAVPPLIDLWQRLKIVAIMSTASSGGSSSHDEL